MVTKKPKGLGKGLEAFFGPTAKESDSHDGTPATPDLPSTLALTDLVAGQYQPRTHMDEGALYELAESIKAQGIMQPILVRRLGEEQAKAKRLEQHPGVEASGGTPRPVYEIIAGERRFRAAKLAGLDSVPVLVRDVPDQAAAAMALIENMQREDLNPLEEAQGLQRLIREFGLTHETAAQAVGRSRSAASNLLRLLNLADPVQTMLMAGDIDMGHARALLALDRATQITAASQIATKKLSVREAESLVKKLSAEFALTSPKPKKEKSRDLKRVEEELSDLLMAQVDVHIKKRVKRNGRLEDMGEVVIQFASLDELNGLIERFSPGVSR
jgi:ParB family chromosome partitioning protein